MLLSHSAGYAPSRFSLGPRIHRDFQPFASRTYEISGLKFSLIERENFSVKVRGEDQKFFCREQIGAAYPDIRWR